MIVKAATLPLEHIEEHYHSKTALSDRIKANIVKEIDNNDEDSFWVYYAKNVTVFIITTYISFLAMFNFIKWRKNRMILKY